MSYINIVNKNSTSRLNQLSFFHSESLLKEAARISKEKQKNRDLFSEIFSTESLKLANSVADQFYNAFRKTFETKEEYFVSLSELQGKSIGSVIQKIRANKAFDPKEAEINKITEAYPQLKNPQYKDDIKALKESEASLNHYGWIFKIFFNEEADPFDEIIKSVYFYQRNQRELKKPLESFKLLSELRAYFDERLASNKEYYYSKIEKHALDPKYTDYIYQSDNFVTVLSGTTQSSQYWARGTTWCTGYLEGNLFASYSSEGICLYYIITKEDSELFEIPNPMRKISIGFIKNDGKPQLLTNQNATVNTDNHNISLNQIQEYLGFEASAIMSAINADLISRDDTKFNQIIAKTTPEELWRQLAEVGDDSRELELIKQFINKDKIRPDTEKVAIKIMADKYFSDFIKMRLYENPKYVKFGLPRAMEMARDSGFNFLNLYLHKIPEYMELTYIAANTIVEKTPYIFFGNTKRYYGIDLYKNYPKLARKAAIKLADEDPGKFISESLYLYPEYVMFGSPIVEKMAKENSSTFFHKRLYRIEEYAKFSLIAAKILAKKDPYTFFYYRVEELFPDLAKEASDNWMDLLLKNDDVDSIFSNKSILEFSKNKVKKIISTKYIDPADVGSAAFFLSSFLASTSLYQILFKNFKDEAKDLIEIASSDIGLDEFDKKIRNRYSASFDPIYKQIIKELKASEEEKLQSLEAWLRTNGFQKEAKDLSTTLTASAFAREKL